MNPRTRILRPLRILIPAGTMALLVAVAAPPARCQAISGELIPSIGVSRAVHTSDNNGQVYGGLAVRATIIPLVKAEVGAAYRQDSFNDGALKVRQWPVTASLWLSPIPMVYAGGGVGWYHTTFHFPESEFNDVTKQQFGAHLGGGIQVPLVPRLAVDLNGRYVFLKKENVPLLDESSRPDFWTVTAGLAIKM